MPRALRLLLVFLLVCLASAPAFARKADRLSPQERYELGLRQMKRGYYTKALEQFNRIRNYNRDDPVALKAELAIADLYFKKGEWAQARMAYEEFQRMHPRNADLDYVVYRIGLTLWKEAPAVAARDQSSTRQAVDVWSGFQARFPSSPHAEDCGKALEKGRNRIARKEFIIGQFYYRRGAWKAVIGRIEPMLAQHPQATVRPDALEILAEAHLQLGDTTRAMEALASLRAIEGQAERARRLERRLDAIRRHHKAS